MLLSSDLSSYNELVQIYANGFYSYDTLVYKFIYVFSGSVL